MTPPGAIQLYQSLVGHYKTGLRENRMTGLNTLVCWYVVNYLNT